MKYIYILLFFVVVSSCNNKQEPKQYRLTEQEVAERLTNANKNRVQRESEKIDEFIKEKKFATERSGTGLRIQIYEKAKNGTSPVMHQEVYIVCKVFLLDGTLCYETDSTNPIAFKIGEGMQIRGLEEGIMKMVPGESARLIIPNHLAYGLSGDEDKIPPGAALFIDVKLLKVK